MSNRSPKEGTAYIKWALILIWIVVAGGALMSGLEYYRTPLVDRAFHPDHELFAPTGKIGHSYGVAGTAMMLLGVLTYSLRKRVRGFNRIGKMRYWLQFHIFLCTLGPFFVVLHSSFKFGGIVSIALWSMIVVVVSGVFGRYVYAWLPKTIHGQFLNAEALDEQRNAILESIWKITDVSPERLDDLIGGTAVQSEAGLIQAIRLSVRERFSEKKRHQRLRDALSLADVPDGLLDDAVALASEQHRIQTQVALLEPFKRLFGYWHVAHLPLVLVLLVILVGHVAVVAAFGYLWVL